VLPSEFLRVLMAVPFLETERLLLELESTEAELARIEAMPAEDRAQVSASWLARLRATLVPSPWTHGISVVERTTGVVVGGCGFKGPPDAEGMVEIAYGLDTAYRGRGYAREAARALSEYALATSGVRCVRAHTLHDNAPSARVLEACGFTCIGDVIDPEDGLVRRWELRGQ
jgi:RimJ/RimL family protein N-acetyltransferase